MPPPRPSCAPVRKDRTIDAVLGEDTRRIELGAFDLAEVIGKGGMARVHRGRHRAQGIDVAVKLLTTDPAHHRTYRDALQNEVRAMARLDHPGIVLVLDYGQVPEAAAEASGGELDVGSPYLVMELADGGTLRRSDVSSWLELKRTLSALLSALAHAHARGVIHRDIKPSNVLVHGAERALRLTDFGIASALGRAGVGSGASFIDAGTAWFMAPEQILGLHRDEGPWTDLYALGCLAYLLACGTTPYAGKQREEIYRAHCLAEIPRLAPSFEVPSDLAAWIAILMAKRPTQRFELAADALSALDQVGGRMLPAGPCHPGEEDAPTATDIGSRPDVGRSSAVGKTFREWDETRVELARDFHGELPETSGGGERAAREQELLAAAIPPIPEDAEERARPTPPRLLGIGLGVYGLRPIPLAGREAERRRLWRCMVDVAAERAPRALVLRGRAGYGKTRLAEWMAERVGELGVAHVLWISHDESPSPLDGVNRMLQHFLRAEGLSVRELEQRLALVTPDLGARTRAQLAALLSPSSDRPSSSRAEERFAVTRDFLVHLTARRPALLVFDDAQFGADSIAFADYLLRLRPADAPSVLAILTAREEALDDRPIEASRLARLAARERGEEIALEALPDRAHAQLIADLLGLEEGLARRVSERTAGSPLFAVQLIGDWVQRGTLIVGEHGFVLSGDADAVVPDDIHALWGERIDRLLETVEAPSREALLTALLSMAVLGRQANIEEWEAACVEAGVPVPEGLLDAMANRRLALVGRQRFTLVHGMLYESLSRRAHETGAWASLHRACAAMLRARHGDELAQAERLGRHLVEAGLLEQALPALLRGAEARLRACEFSEAREVCERYDQVLDALGAPADDVRRAHGWIMHADVTGTQTLLEECGALLARAEPVVRAHGDGAALAEVLRLKGGINLKRGQLVPAKAYFEEGRQLNASLGQRRGEGLCLHGLGEAQKLLGQLDESMRAYSEACVCLDEQGDLLAAARSRTGMADVHRRRGELDPATELLERCVDIMRRLGNRHSEGVCLNSLGDLERIRGDLGAAGRRYREALATFDAIASEEATIVRLNLGLVLLARREWEGARELFEAARPELNQAGREGYLGYLTAGLYACAAGLHEWDDVQALEAQLAMLLEQSGIVDDDIATCMETAGEECATERRVELARGAWALARAQWRGLSRAEREAAIEERERALG